MTIDKREKVLVPIELGKGMNEAQAEELAGPGSLRRLENAVYTQRGTIHKRDGYKSLGKARIDGTSRDSAYALGTTKQSVAVYDGATVDLYSPTANVFASTGFGPQLGVVSAPVVGVSGEPIQYQSVACNGYVLCAYYYDPTGSGGPGSIRCVVLDEKTLEAVTAPFVVLSGVTFSSNYAQMRLAMAGNCAHVLLQDFGGSSGNAYSEYVDLTNSSTIYTGPQTGITYTGLVSDANKAVPRAVDLVGDSANLYLATINSANSSHVAKFNTTGTLVSNTNSNAATMVSIAKSGDNLYLARYNAGNVHVDVFNATDLSLAPQQVLALDNVGANATAMCLMIGAINSNAATVVHANTTATTYRSVVGTQSSATTGINRSQVLNWQAMARPFALNDEVYFVARERSANAADVQGEKTLAGLHATTSHNLYANVAFVLAPRLAPYDTYDTSFGTWAQLHGQHTHNTYDGQVAGLFPRQKLSSLSGTTDGISFDYVRFSRDPADMVIQPVQFGDELYASGGVSTMMDGSRCTESGFVSRPLVTYSNSAAGSVTGNVAYVAIYERLTASGSVVWSQPSDPVIVAASSNTINATVYPLAVTSSVTDDGESFAPTIALYRTVNNGSTYYRVAARRDTGAVQYITDNTTDTALVSLPKLYTQPGTPGTSQTRQCPPASTFACAHQDRIWLVGDDGVTLWYSAPRVQGEAAWFNNLFTIPLEESGRATGLASFDNRLLVFKAGDIFVIDGQGPPENGGSGNEFAPPYKLPFGTGCIDPGSIIATNGSVFFRSTTGIEMLDRRLQVSYVGEPVRDTLASYPVVTSATSMSDDRVIFTCRETDTIGTTGNGAILVYHTRLGAWSVDLVEESGGDPNAGFVDCTTQNLDGEARTWLLDPEGGLYVQRASDDADRYKDSVEAVRLGLETNWVRATESLADRQRVWNNEVSLRMRSNCSLNAAWAYDYVNTFDTDVRMNESVLGASGIAVVKFQPDTPQNMAVKVRLTETANTTNVGVGTSEGFEVLGVSLEIAPKSGAHDPAATKKG